MPTVYPKCSPTELLGLLVLLEGHKGSEDVALLADDLDLEIDEIFPSLEFAEVLQLVTVTDGRATFTDLGRKLVAASIRERKTILRALENSPSHKLSDEELGHIVSFTTARADDAEQNIVNWGRYTDLFRYDAEEHVLIAVRRPANPRSGGGRSPPPATPASPAPAPVSTSRKSPGGDPPASLLPTLVTA